MRRDDICICVSPTNRARLEAIIAGRNSSSKAVWRAEIVLATADGLDTNAIIARTGKSKPCVWRWQERYIDDGVDGLLRDKTRPLGTKPLSAAVKRKVLAKTATQTPADAGNERAHDGGGSGSSSDPTQVPDMPAARSPRTLGTREPRPAAQRRASPLSAVDVLQDRVVQHCLGKQLLQLGVLVFERSEPLCTMCQPDASPHLATPYRNTGM